MILWLVSYVANLTTIYHVGKDHGMNLSFSQRTREYYIGTPGGIVGPRSTKRHTIANRWDSQLPNKFKVVPWEVQGKEDINVKMEPECYNDAIDRISVKASFVLLVVRRSKITTRDLRDMIRLQMPGM